MSQPSANDISSLLRGGAISYCSVPFTGNSSCANACKRMSNFTNSTSRPNLTQQQKAKILLFLLSRYISNQPQSNAQIINPSNGLSYG
jgi:hypothetical protein